MTERLENLNVNTHELLVTPAALKARMPMTDRAARSVAAGREAIRAILEGNDPRLIVVVGPCSIHDVDAALDYAQRLCALRAEVDDTLLVVMRTYFEKPRTTVGWKGLINDPDLDDSFRIDAGLRTARGLLIDLAELGLPLATEALDPIAPQYIHDLIAWSAIGARTTESQTHREMASGLSSAIGFKNGTDGGLDVAINALQSVAKPHRFLGIDGEGRVTVIGTRGNPWGHVVLRGGRGRTNFDADSIAACEQALIGAGLPRNIMVDCSHDNSGKDPARQPGVVADVVDQIRHGNESLVGVMLESFIGAGNQPMAPRDALRYGVSITDGCIDWDTTAEVLRDAADALRDVIATRNRHREAATAV